MLLFLRTGGTHLYVHTCVWYVIYVTKITGSVTPSNMYGSGLTPRTPLSGRAVRKVARMLRENPSSKLLDQVLHGSGRIVAMHECAQHEVRGPIEAIALEERKWVKSERRARANGT